MSYESQLPSVFPWRLQTTRTTVRYLVNKLIDPKRYLHGNGVASSFAITTDAPAGMWNLWLSECSKEYLVSHFSHLSNTIIGMRNDA